MRLDPRTLLAVCALGVVMGALAACGGTSKNSASDQTVQKDAALFQIDQVERAFHRAGSTHDVNLMMSLFAPGAVFNLGLETFSGKARIRKFFATHNAAFQPQNDWESDTPSYKIRETVNGDKATLYFECHYVDVKTGEMRSVIGVDHNLQRIDGKWLIVDASASTATLST
jgi:ketosteroid isomerase-like protein